MKMMNGKLQPQLLLLIFTLSFFSVFLIAQEVEQGKVVYQRCVSCHGDVGEGNSVIGAPALAGQNKAYLVRQIKNFKTGIRGSHPSDTFGRLMADVAITLKHDANIYSVSTYINSLPITYPAGQVNGDQRLGANLYMGSCGACHGPGGEGIEALSTPRLTGLSQQYFSRQIAYFKQGIRGAHPKDRYGKQMNMMVKNLKSDRDVQNVEAYIHHLPKK